MLKKYKFPTYLFVVFEKLKTQLWFNSLDKKMDYYAFVQNNWFFSVSVFLKKSLFLNTSYLLESTAVDLNSSNYYDFNFTKSKNLILHTFYFFLIKSRVALLTNTDGGLLKSIDCVYSNANWLEREFSEMYGIDIHNKIDSRKLLLNYCEVNTPMKKNLDSKGSYEVYFDFSENQLTYLNCLDIEL